ncbi:VanZ family protein [Caldisalinibacter kiritimatiensis]|uniref:Putative phosphotransbutyrylase n=1 Tax=Caldisalinibacter kiritimatiensis TaxID=1304284 RepID=R1CRG3_9FIRM|nr:VanZ family protein [Caldisalinibacter kiritimatiensis]EOC99298.1 Putative phosphotransbutyrylase [Caldisalinibacter kiritimatiensis]
MLKKLFYIFLIILWMNVIFSFSSEIGYVSDSKSSNIAKHVYKSFEKVEFNAPLNVKDLNYIIRKIGHVTEYFILTILILGFLNTLNLRDKYKYLIAIIIPSIYACIDEYNQIFISGRDGSIKDVAIDIIGILGGILVNLCINKLRKELYSRM